MRILFAVPYTPNHIRVRPYELLLALLRCGHDVTLATLWTSRADQEDLERLEQMGARILAQPMPAWRSAANSLLALPTRTPLQAVYSWQPSLFALLLEAQKVQPFDVMHVEHLRGSRYGLEFLRRLDGAPGRPAVVWDSVDCISHLFAQAASISRSPKSRLITRIELPRTQRYEAELPHRFDHTVVTSAIDKAALTTLAQQAATARHTAAAGRPVEAAIDVLPNGVDLQLFAYGEPEQRHTNRIVFSGKMSYHANVTAALHLVNDIMPLVWAQRPDAEVWIVGKDPAPELRALGEAAAGGERRVVVTGEVPAMWEYIQAATVAVAPLLYGAGIQNKVLEAMACGAPVIATTQASQSLAAIAGQDYWQASDVDEFAAAILALLQSPARRVELGCAGRRFVESHHSWDSAAAQLTAIYTAAIKRLNSSHSSEPRP
jgi:glycosyltransferase involved in cell wall biosynthesis